MSIIKEAIASCRLDGETQCHELTFFVNGVPMPKGSMNSFISPRTKKIVTLHGTKESRPRFATWNTDIKAAALTALRPCGWSLVIDKPVEVFAAFYLPRPKSHYRKNGELNTNAVKWHAKKPDVDKLVRTVLDAIVGIAFYDDSQCARIVAQKTYSDQPGLGVTVRILG